MWCKLYGSSGKTVTSDTPKISNKDIFNSIKNNSDLIKSSTIHTFNPQNGNIIHCPKCNNPINVGDSGNFTGICNRCHTRFDYFQNAKSIKMKNENPYPNQPGFEENDKLSLNSSSNLSSQQTTQKKGLLSSIGLILSALYLIYLLCLFISFFVNWFNLTIQSNKKCNLIKK